MLRGRGPGDSSQETTLGHPGQMVCSDSVQNAEAQWIPVILLCGFLGAGKTTLLCKLLEQVNDEILVIVNDIASINIDGAVRDKIS